MTNVIDGDFRGADVRGGGKNLVASVLFSERKQEMKGSGRRDFLGDTDFSAVVASVAAAYRDAGPCDGSFISQDVRRCAFSRMCPT